MSAASLPASTQDVVDPADVQAFHARHPVAPSRHAARWRLALIMEVALILALWEVLISGFEVIPPAFLPPPSAIAASVVQLIISPPFVNQLVYSVSNLVVGVLIASLAGVSVGLAVGWLRPLEITVAPLIWTMYSIPKVALAPLIILGLGLGPASKILLVVLVSFFPVALNTMLGTQTVDPSLIHAARVFGTRGWRLAIKVIIPATLPFILVGLRRAVALGFIGEILGEFLGGADGLGYLLGRATVAFRMDDALAIVAIMVIFANAGLIALDLIRRRLAPWHSEGPVHLA